MAGIRVIAGKAKGRKLGLVPGESTRPVGARVKEAFFNIIGPDIEGSHFLDLFAGTGSVGIEALSRGASSATMVDSDRQAINTIVKNLETTLLKESAVVLQRDAFRFLEKFQEPGFDYVYVAPPQYKGLWERVLLELDQNPTCLNPDAWVIVQIHPREFKELELENLQCFDERKYGNTLLLFFEFPGS